MKGIEGLVFKYFLVVILAMTIFSCEEEDKNDPNKTEIRPLTSQELYLVESSNLFAINLLHDSKENIEGNFLISPLSTGMTLSMVGNLGDDLSFESYSRETALPDLNKTEINKAYYELSNMLPHLDESVNMSFANSIWSKYKLYENDDFYTKILAYYNTDIHELRAEKDYDLEVVNKWIQTKSDFELESIEGFDLNSNFQIINSAFFEAKYFNDAPHKVIQTSFESDDQKPTTVDLNLYLKKKVFISELENQTSLEIPLGNSNFVLNIIIPIQGWDIDLSESHGFDVEFDQILLPNIITEYEFNSLNILEKTDARNYLQNSLTKNFLSDIPLNPTVNLINKSYVSISGFHKNKNVEFNDKGDLESSDNVLVLNKPFYYLIKEKNSDLILFEGKFNTPI